MTKKRFGMYQNTLYDNGDILNPFNAMKLLNHFDKENAKLKEENEQLKQLVNEAEDIILCQCTPHYQRQWENIKKNLGGDVE